MNNQIKHMVDKFLGWKLPKDFGPDAGISFEPEYNKDYMAKQGKPPIRHEPIGTNLFHAGQAEAMFEYCAGDLIAELATSEAARKKAEFDLEATRDCLLYERNRLLAMTERAESAEQRIKELEARSVPEGWKLVPVDIANEIEFRNAIAQQFGVSFLSTKDRWHWLLAASPKPEGVYK